MIRGRKPIPTAVRRVTGRNPDRIKPDEPKPDPTVPQPPAWLTPEALAEWNRLAPQLHMLGLLTAIDGTTFGARCQIVADLADAERKLAKFGPVMRSSDRRDRLVLSPYTRIRDRLRDQLFRADAEFGLTPSARSRVEARPPVAEVDPARKYLDS
jgi:P27 family predicted phage terminase small subunit